MGILENPTLDPKFNLSPALGLRLNRLLFISIVSGADTISMPSNTLSMEGVLFLLELMVAIVFCFIISRLFFSKSLLFNFCSSKTDMEDFHPFKLFAYKMDL